MNRTLEGGCQCGSVRYKYASEVLNIFVCHCIECQKQTGSACAMGLWVQESGLQRLRGTLRHWMRRLPSGQNMICEFCDQCGTRMYHTSDSNKTKGIVSIKPGTLDDTTWLQPRAHIWTCRAQPWMRIDPEQRQYLRNPPDLSSLDD